FTHRDQDVDARIRQKRRETLVQRAVRVVQEVLLELVEDEERLADRLRELRVNRPLVEDDDVGIRRALTQPPRDGGPKDRAPADAAGPVQDGEARREEVGDDHFGLALATEEEKRVELRVLERRKTLVRRDEGGDRLRAHVVTSVASPRYRARPLA